jgi:hypothetical protein
MKALALYSLLLASGFLGLAQNPADQEDKAPPAIDEALRARVTQYYQAFMAGKFKEAYPLVADDSQDAFFEADKAQYKACETIKIRYSDNFTKASVIESCKSEWKWHGMVTPVTFPITTNWKIIDGKWFWSYVKPTQTPFPFSPSGFINVPPDTKASNGAPNGIPTDLKSAAQNILAKVSLDKQAVHLRPDETSQDVIHVHNSMPGMIKLRLDQLAIPGLKITLGKTNLGANEDTTVSFEYKLDDPGIACVDCAKKLQGTSVVALHIIPTGQTFSIPITFATPVPSPGKPQTQAPQQ